MLTVQADLPALIARVVLGALFVIHGYPKVKDLKKTAGWVKSTGFPGGAAFATPFSLLEFFGGLALIAGLLTQVVALLFVLEMAATTIFSKYTLKKKLVLGYELDILYLVLALVIVLLGAGAWSVDRLIGLA